MPQDHTSAPPPMDIQVGDVWECRDGLTRFTITDVSEIPDLFFPIQAKGEEGYEESFTNQGLFYEYGVDNDLDLVKLIIRNGSPINHT